VSCPEKERESSNSERREHSVSYQNTRTFLHGDERAKQNKNTAKASYIERNIGFKCWGNEREKLGFIRDRDGLGHVHAAREGFTVFNGAAIRCSDMLSGVGASGKVYCTRRCLDGDVSHRGFTLQGNTGLRRRLPLRARAGAQAARAG
jgi:hypothetical protein